MNKSKLNKSKTGLPLLLIIGMVILLPALFVGSCCVITCVGAGLNQAAINAQAEKLPSLPTPKKVETAPQIPRTAIKPKPIEPPEPSMVVISAKELFARYKANEIAADELYNDKIIVVTGKVNKIGKDIMNSMYVGLDTGNMIMSVQCFFGDEHEGQLAGLSKGMEVKVKGRCGGILGNVLIKDCELIR